MPRLSIVIPTWDVKDLLCQCLESIFRQNYKDFEVIVVDNGSKDGSQELIHRQFPQVNLICNRGNKGACFARNQGIEIARGDLILTLDADVILSENFLKEMVNSLNGSKQKIGMVGAKVYNENRKICTTGILITKIRRFYDRGKGQRDYGQFDRKLEIFGPSSAAALYKREMLEETKIKDEYFDNDFFFLVEDVDISWRANKLGWRAKFAPRAVCFHQGNSSKTDKKMRQYLCFRNRYFLILKNENFLRLILLLPVFLFYEIPRFLYLLVSNPYTLNIFRDVKKHFKSMMGKRKMIREKILNK